MARKKAVPADSIEARFWAKVDCSGNCWNWCAAKTAQGYGKFARNNRWVRAHRLSWEMLNGPLPSGALVLHRCDNPSCVNPAHLRIGSHADNMRDMAGKGRQWRQRRPATHCKRGHPFDAENTITYRRNGNIERQCRACHRALENSIRATYRLNAKGKPVEVRP